NDRGTGQDHYPYRGLAPPVFPLVGNVRLDHQGPKGLPQFSQSAFWAYQDLGRQPRPLQRVFGRGPDLVPVDRRSAVATTGGPVLSGLCLPGRPLWRLFRIKKNSAGAGPSCVFGSTAAALAAIPVIMPLGLEYNAYFCDNITIQTQNVINVRYRYC